MTSRELEMLNIMHQLGGQASMRAISKKMGLSLDYSRVLSQALLRQHLLEQTAGQFLTVTAQGRLLAERRGKVRETAVLDLIEAARLISRQTGVSPTLPPEPSFLSGRFVEEPVSFVQHDLNKNQTVELADARSIQASTDGLISINSKRSKH